MTSLDARKQLQTLLDVSSDGIIGPRTLAALHALAGAAPESDWPAPVLSAPPNEEVHSVMASNFADPADVAAYRKAKARGLSDQEAFKVGDNGIGKWGDDTTSTTPMCALPPEDWEHLGAGARGAKVLVCANKASVVCELRDTMPHKKNITNGCALDLNEAACNALGLRIPMTTPATWQWV